MDGRIVIGTPFSDHQHRNRGLLRPKYLEHALSDLTRVVQGSDLEQRPLAFEQVLKFIRTIRSTRRRPVTFIGISRTGLNTNMVRQIVRTIAYLPPKTGTGPGPVLEMQKVFARAPQFISPSLN